MAKILDSSRDAIIAEAIGDALDELGCEPHESIPGLVLAIQLESQDTDNAQQAVDEAIDLLNGE